MSGTKLPGGAISWMAQNPVAANLLMFALIVGGLLSAMQIKKEVFPEFIMDTVMISVSYPGASPEEVERGVVQAIEEQVRDLEGVKRVDSQAGEGQGTVSVELQSNTDIERALMDIKNAVDRIVTFPNEAERPLVSLAQRKRGVMDLVLYGDIPEQNLRELAENIRERMLLLPGVSIVDLTGVRDLEIGVEISSETLRRNKLTLPDVAAKIQSSAIEQPSGGVKAEGGEVLLRINERRYHASDFADIPILSGENQQPVTLGQLATLDEGFEDKDLYAKFNGKRAVLLSLYSLGTESPAEVAVAVKDFTERLKKELPPTIQTAIWNDSSQMFIGRLNLLLKNAAMGLVLVLFILGLVLEPKLAFWVALGIPASFMGAFFLLPLFDISLNMISMFAFMITLGMVVDDAIVVGENIYHLRKEGVPPLKASVMAAREMAVPVFFSIATTLAAFSPLLFVPGMIGKIQFAIPIIVGLVLAFSLAESFFVLPAHLVATKIMGKDEHEDKPRFFLLRWQQVISGGLERFIETRYRPLVSRAVHHPGITLAISVAFLLTVVGLYTGGYIKSIDFPGGDRDEVVAQAVLPYGVNVLETEKVVQKLSDAAHRALSKLKGESQSLGMMSTIGMGRGSDESGTHVCSVVVLLKPLEERAFSSKEFAMTWQRELGELVGIESLGFSSTRHGLRKPLDFILSHSDVDTLEKAAKETASYLSAFNGVKDVDDGIEEGKPQWNFKLTPEGANAGLTASAIGQQLRGSFYGAEALRQQQGRNEVKVMVRLPEAERESLKTVEDLMVRTPAGEEIPLSLAATTTKDRAYKSIARTNGRRTLRIQADVDTKIVNAQDVQRTLFSQYLPDLENKYPGLSAGLRGRAEDFQNFREFIVTGFIMALIGVYVLIAIPLRSYLQPFFVVMMAIPFGATGALFSHFVLGMSVSMFSLMGLLALSGVVVNDSIVFVTTANDLRRQGLSATEAAIQAGTRRFRPILLTTITTFFGLAPLIFETSPEAQMLIPMAVSLGFGILVSTCFVLLLIPSLFTMVEYLREWAGTINPVDDTERRVER